MDGHQSQKWKRDTNQEESQKAARYQPAMASEERSENRHNERPLSTRCFLASKVAANHEVQKKTPPQSRRQEYRAMALLLTCLLLAAYTRSVATGRAARAASTPPLSRSPLGLAEDVVFSLVVVFAAAHGYRGRLPAFLLRSGEKALETHI